VDTLIIALSEKDVPGPSKTFAHILLKDLASSHPKLFKDVIPTLVNWIIAQAAEVVPGRSSEEKTAVEDTLKTLARLGLNGLDLDLPGKQGKEFIAALKTFALNGETGKQGRRATAVLLKMKRKTLHADDLVKVCHPQDQIDDRKSFRIWNLRTRLLSIDWGV
jgi:Sister chromatid cohesion protein PDS5 protein